MSSLHWARLKGDAPYPLRRGAWYRVMKLTSTEVVVDVKGQRVVVPRWAMDLVETPPGHWTIVPRPRRTARFPQGWGEQYAVCPNCRNRAPLEDAQLTLRCPRCNELFPIAWG